MQRGFMRIPLVRNRLYTRALERFLQEQEDKGVVLRNEAVAERLPRLRTVLIDDPLIMQRDYRVRKLLAPLALCTPGQLKHQGSWMVLMAGIALGCGGFGPLENLAREMNFEYSRITKQYPQIQTLHYDAERRMETTVHRDRDGFRAYAKGDVDAVLDCCTRVLDGREREMTYTDRCQILQEVLGMVSIGLTCVAFATRWRPSPGAYESEMVFLGVAAMGDQPHPEAPQAMEALREAGIRPVLVSERPLPPGTVRASGVLRVTAGMMDAEEMDAMNDAKLREASEHVDAYVGIDWKRKARLARDLRKDGTVGTLSFEPQSEGLVLAIGDGAEPDVVLEQGGVYGLIDLVTACRRLERTYQTEPKKRPEGQLDM